MILYGIKSCDTCRKALKWLDQNRLPYAWVDLKTQEIETSVLEHLVDGHLAGTLNLINKSSTAWRGLSDPQKEAVNTGQKPDIIRLLTQTPTLIKRPLIENRGEYSCGFKDDVKARLLP